MSVIYLCCICHTDTFGCKTCCQAVVDDLVGNPRKTDHSCRYGRLCCECISFWLSWTAKKTNEWVLNKAGVKRELLDTVKARKLAYYGHTMRKQGSCLEKEIMQGTMPGARR